MDDGLREQALEWFARAEREIETAQLLYDLQGHVDAVAYHMQQTIEKYLKGYLVLNGKEPPWIHELDSLLKKVKKFSPDLYQPFIELCEKATKFYVEGRYPPGPLVEYTREEIKADLDLTYQLVGLIREKAQLAPINRHGNQSS
jgi:HEPN domain-containing protein